MKPVILALSPGTRITGLALFRNGELVDWEVHCFHGPWNRHKQKKINTYFVNLLKQSDITHLGIRIPSVVSPSFQWMLSTLKELALHHRIVIQSFPLFLLKESYAPSTSNATRKILQERIIEEEPDLQAALPHPYRLKKEYYAKMIEAIGVGRAYLNILSPAP